MPEFKTIKDYIERRTYLKGKFYGKFIGTLDKRKSDIKHENYYDLEVLSGELSVQYSDFRIWKEGDEFEEFVEVEEFLTRIPGTLPCTILYVNGETRHFNIHLNEPKLSNYYLSNQHYEGERIFGDIVGDISGYLKHYDVEEREIEIDEEQDSKEIEDGRESSVSAHTRTDRPTGKTETRGNYKRSEYYNTDNSTYWGDWVYQKSDNGFSLWGLISGLIQAIFAALIILPLLVLGGKFLLPLLVIGLAIWLLTFIGPVLRLLWVWLMRLIGIAFLISFAIGIFSILKRPVNVVDNKQISKDDVREVTTTKPDDAQNGDSIISHHRIWQDYNSNEYIADIEVGYSFLLKSNAFRNNLNYSFQSTSDYNNIVSQIQQYDEAGLPRVYSMFDSIRSAKNLDEIEFAQVITSCIQDIPYTLILDKSCDARLYDDEFIRDYLGSGGQCEGFIKYGLLSPVEFVASLKGDCDTRTLLLFTILNHYKYDVAMLGSEMFKHSIIAINLPFNGISKTINGKRYVIWETTEKGVPPGNFPNELSDMRFWSVNLISNNQAI
ncbi:MAG: hypothetical protein U0073_00080 [Bacteroidia bacterium]